MFLCGLLWCHAGLGLRRETR
uniref:Uncharacterized protein n=1 Tax=Anguilla anguilla TaxID=7936 RepID=A0A0E9Q5W9_ANGAN